MGSGNERKVRTGERLRISAETWNSVIDSIRKDKRDRGAVGRGGVTNGITPTLDILILNRTAIILPLYAVVKLQKAVGIADGESKVGIAKRPLLTGIIPVSANDAIGIVQTAMGKGDISTAIISGVTVCNILINDSLHEFANPIPGRTDVLGSAACGQVRILTILVTNFRGSGSGTDGGSGSGATEGVSTALVQLIGNCVDPGIAVSEVDGAPNVSAVTQLQFDQADGFVITNPSAGVARVDFNPVATGVIAVQEVDGAPAYTAISSLRFDQTDGFVLTQPVAGSTRIDIAAATASQAGIVSTASQTFEGNKTFTKAVIIYSEGPAGPNSVSTYPFIVYGRSNSSSATIDMTFIQCEQVRTTSDEAFSRLVWLCREGWGNGTTIPDLTKLGEIRIGGAIEGMGSIRLRNSARSGDSLLLKNETMAVAVTNNLHTTILSDYAYGVIAATGRAITAEMGVYVVTDGTSNTLNDVSYIFIWDTNLTAKLWAPAGFATGGGGSGAGPTSIGITANIATGGSTYYFVLGILVNVTTP